MSTTPTAAPPAAPKLAEGFPEELVSSALFLLKRLGMRAKEQSFVAYEGAGLRPYHPAILAVLDGGARRPIGAATWSR